jgi:hypothetical protein
MLTPNAFSIRSAISGERPALPSTKSESVARQQIVSIRRLNALRPAVAAE